MKKFLNFFKNHSEVLIIIWLFLMAFFLRIFHFTEFAAYHQDQVRDLIYIKNHFDAGSMILLGPKASIGSFFLPPFWYYLMSIAFVFSKSPLAPAFMVILFSSFTTVIIYLFSRKFFGQNVAFFSALLYAVSHMSIEHSRFAWNPNPIPFFVILTFYFLYEYLLKNKKNSFYFGIIVANLSLQLHYQGFVVLAFFYLILLFYKKIDVKQFIYSILINIILVLPFIVYEIKNQFPNSQGIINFISSQSKNNLKYFGVPFFIKYIVREFSLFLSRTIVIKERILGYLFLFGLGVSFILKSNDKKYSVLKIFLIFSIAMLFFYKNSLIDFYLLFLIPIIIIYFVITLNKYLPGKIALLIFCVIALVSVYTSPSFYGFDKTFLSVSQAVKLTTSRQNYCHVYKIFPETFIENKIKYLVSLEKNSPIKIGCEKILSQRMCFPNVKTVYYLCEPAKCQNKFDLKIAKIINQDGLWAGVDIYQFDY